MFNRTFAAVLLSLFVPSFAYAAESDDAAKTTDSGNGGYGAPELKITHLAGSPALLMGSQGGWIAKHHFTLGGGGYGLVSDVTSKGVEKPISLGYGGLRLGFILGEKDDRFHFGAAALFGAAGMGVGDTSTTAWVMEPEVNADVSAVRWLRVGVSAGYRFMMASSNNDANLTFAQMSGFSAGIQFKFGSF
jgi:hypothetical protein